MTEQIRIRYSKNKNTLVTKRIEDRILFAIARCNLAMGDKFFRSSGRDMAKMRLEGTEVWVAPSIDVSLVVGSVVWERDSLFLSRNQLWGWCNVADVKKLLDHFHNIDESVNMERRLRYNHGVGIIDTSTKSESCAFMCTHEDVHGYNIRDENGKLKR